MHNEAHELSAEHECQLWGTHLYPSFLYADMSKGSGSAQRGRTAVSDMCAKLLSFTNAINYPNNMRGGGGGNGHTCAHNKIPGSHPGSVALIGSTFRQLVPWTPSDWIHSNH